MTLDDKDYLVRFIDGDGKGGLSAPAPDGQNQLDQVIVRQADGQKAVVHWGALGQPARIGGKWYRLDVDSAGTQFEARPVALPTAFVHVPADDWKMVLLDGQTPPVLLSGGREPVPLPPGTYKRFAFLEYRPQNETGMRWMAIGAAAPDAEKLVLAEGQTLEQRRWRRWWAS